jgi:anthraniloyl-CoA monooxygenase
MKILCLGGGPASLYFSILMKNANPEYDITVIERGGRDSTWGFGVVFSDETLRGLMEADAPTYKRIVEQFVYWGGIDTRIHGKTVYSGGHGFCGMARLKLLNILHDRCDELGVNLRFNTDISSVAELAVENYDLVVAGDGISSIIRTAHEDAFGTTIDHRANKFCWLATTKRLDNFTFTFRNNEHGWWWAHAYGYEAGMTTWIVECSEETWQAAGLNQASEEDTIAYCEAVFSEDLDGHPLIANQSVWRTFPVIRNERLYYKNMVLVGDAVRSAHFSIGSGTKLAMEDAIELAACFRDADVAEALVLYQQRRKGEADRLQRTAVVSLSWFEHVDRYAAVQSAEQFAFNMLCRSKRVTYENLKLRDAGYIRHVDEWFAREARAYTGYSEVDVHRPIAPVFQPFCIGPMRVENRFQLSAMCQYSAENGNTNDWHLVHYGSRAVGGAGLLNTEMICISADARITPGCVGLWTDTQAKRWAQIVDFVHANSTAKICAQIGHAGRKGATELPWDGGMDEPLVDGAWEIVSASALPYLPHSQVPREATAEDIARIGDDFVSTAAYAAEAGFDMLELHMAHGYLLSSFISPVTNRRDDEYGGDIDARMRFPLQVLARVRGVWPEDRPISVRISATDWIEGGLTPDEMLTVARLLKTAGVDVLNVSTGQLTPDEAPVYGRMFQTPFADQIRNEVGIATIVAGNISTADQANTLIAAGRTDIVALGRALLNEPHFVLNAAADYGHAGQVWPKQYLSGKPAAASLAAADNQEMYDLRVRAKPPNPREALAIAMIRGELLQD